MKLVCSKGRRVMVLDSGSVIHREDGSACSDEGLKLGKKVIYRPASFSVIEESVGVGETGPLLSVVAAAVERAMPALEQWEREHSKEET